MVVLAHIRSLDDLLLAVPLPDASRVWFERPLRQWQLNVITIRKSSGLFRRVVEPTDDSLVRLQKQLKEFLVAEVSVSHPAVHGFTKDRGPYTNAVAHLDAPAILTVDISDFFSSISFSQIESTLRDAGVTAEVATGIANISTFEGVLATGFSTSPVLSNMYFRDTDVLLETLARELNLTYTRYADDLTFSGEDVNDSHLEAVTQILVSKGLRVNERKVRFQRRGHPQFVTGYVVAHPDHPRVSRYFKRRLRLDLHYVRKFGLEQQARIRGVSSKGLAKQLKGRISYLMGSERDLAVQLREEFEPLLQYDEE